MAYFAAGERPTADKLNSLAKGRLRVLRTSAQSIVDSAVAKIEFDTVVKDDGGLWDDAAFELVVPPGYAGWWMLTASVCYAGHITGRRACDIRTPGTRLVSALQPTNPTAADVRYTSSTLAALAVGDRVYVEGFQTSGAALNVQGSATNITHFAACLLIPD
ncbi:hypothetical protein [Glycomyces paridis]|uniref:Uncharacterized protein n=1 Tax=Glycomyces paridis TaxID=2126555 RepID=A0A4S8PC99_9ACTN|nr:hypothetical protein [Glycomyces paridis]THV27948.1 hypothetical protein E9998_13235 [Glycomyces paridis]